MRPQDRKVVALLGFFHGVVHANILAIPVFLNFAWGAAFNAEPFTLGLLFAIAFGLYGVGALPFGLLADRRPPGPLLVLSAAGIGASMAAVAVSPTIPVLALSLGALGFASAVYHPTGLAVLSRATAEQGRAMGWHGMGGSLGIAAGPAFVGAALSLGWSWRVVAGALVLPAIMAVVLLVAVRLPISSETDQHGAPAVSRRALLTGPFFLILLVYMFAGFAYQGGLAFLPHFVGPGLFALALAFGAVGQVASGRLADRPRPERTLFALSLVGALLLLALAVLASSTSLQAVFGGTAIVFGLVLFSLEPLQNILVTREVPRPLRGSAFGLTFLSVFGIGALGAVLAGWLLQQNQNAVLFLVLGVSLAASGAAAAGVRGRTAGS
jgi:MFS family permease